MSRDNPPDRGGRTGGKRRFVRVLLIAAVVLVLALAAGGVWLQQRLRASLPMLTGEVAVAGLDSPVEIARDALGVPAVRGAGRNDVALATGFLHAQERFFQMDLVRRRAAGELAELFGPAVLPVDRELRRYRFRALAGELLAASPAADRELLAAYTTGVNAGLSALAAPPPEYLLLRLEPQPWRDEDSLLTILGMFYLLQGDLVQMERWQGLMHEALPPELVAFLLPPGDEWDAPMLGEPLAVPPIPGPEVIDLRRAPPRAAALAPAAGAAEPAAAVAGSNAWALAGDATAGGGALVANDMHLPLSVPGTWYRASLLWPAAGGGEHRVTGATLPGVPLMVVGSNGHLAWGFANGQVDVIDLVVIEPSPGDAGSYLTPDGPLPFELHREVLRVKGGADESLEVPWTIWGPVIEAPGGRRLAVRWVVYEPGAVGLGSRGLETAQDVDAGVEAATASGLPAQNVVLADAGGRVAWTMAGRLPQRFGHDGSRPLSWAAGDRGWQGLLPAAETPRLVDPEGGRVWAANNRPLGGEELAKLGDGGFVPGTRAGRIRDLLAVADQATPGDMLAIQLDDSAFFHQRWRRLLLTVLDAEAVAAEPRRGAFREQLESSWSGHADVGSVGYRLVRGARRFLSDAVFAPLTAPCNELDPDFRYGTAFLRQEGPLWALVSERPPHLLAADYADWQEQILAGVDDVLEFFGQAGLGPLDELTWGRYNLIAVRHPLSTAVPALGRWLDMPTAQQPGDINMPRVMTPPAFGASQRMSVSPGHEEEGLFHMPGGQSGHPLSPHYSDGHAAWVAGEAMPFLPGPPVAEMRLVPAG